MSAATPPQPSADVPFALRLTAGYLWRLGVVAAAVYFLSQLMGYFSALVIPFLVALLLAALLHPLVETVSRWMPRGLAVVAAMLVTIASIVGLFTLVGTQIAGQMAQLTQQALAGFATLQNWLAKGPLNLGSAQIDAYVQQITAAASENSTRIAEQAVLVTTSAGEVVTGLVLALFTLIFLLLDGHRIWLWAVHLVPRHARDAADAAGRAAWVSLTAYVRATIMVAFTDAVGIAIGAAILGVPLAIPLGVLVFLGAFVPIVGALISGAVAVLVALVALGFVKALIMLGIVLLVQQVESHVLQPFLMGRMVSVHPLAVVMAIGAGIVIAGIPGALFAVPLAAVVNTVGQTLAARHPQQHVASLEEESELSLTGAASRQRAQGAAAAAQVARAAREAGARVQRLKLRIPRGSSSTAAPPAGTVDRGQPEVPEPDQRTR